MLNKFWRLVLLFLVFAPIASIGIFGCGGVDPQPQPGDFDASAIDAEAERAAAGQGEPSVPGPAGEPTTSEGP